ncbi:zinc-binding dehydrogenase [Micromonospora sp. MS34]|uniref:zinc-binding dehydrogenase n=1 Tax=Micromonospora sp. MS34 TaxID=3385971 RepID=UPI00399F2939
MRAVIVRQFGGPEVLEVAEVPVPDPGPGQVRVRVAAASVNRIDVSTRNGALTQAGLLAPAAVVWLGWDVAGEVDVVGAAGAGVAAHEAVRGGGTFVALVAPFAPPPLRATRVIVSEVFADGARLAELSALVDAGRISPRVADSLPLAEVAQAHRRLVAGGTRGRLVLVP